MLGLGIGSCPTCDTWLRALVDGVCFVEEPVMQGVLFEGQYVATAVPGVKAEHAECQRTGFGG